MRNMNTIDVQDNNIRLKPSALADWLVSHGRVTITTEEAARLLGVPTREVPQRLIRLRNKGQLIALGRGLWVVVPPEYREMGAPEPMKYMPADVKRMCKGTNVDAKGLAIVGSQAKNAKQKVADWL